MAGSQLMLTVEWLGREQLEEWIITLGLALEHAHLELEMEADHNGLCHQGMRIADITCTVLYSGRCVIMVRPTASMILFAGWLTSRMPSTHRTVVVDGWPYITCPPNDDRLAEDDPAPLTPNLLVPA